LEVVEMSWNTIGMMCSDQMAIWVSRQTKAAVLYSNLRYIYSKTARLWSQERRSTSSLQRQRCGTKKLAEPRPPFETSSRQEPYWWSLQRSFTSLPSGPSQRAPRREQEQPACARSGPRDLAQSSRHDVDDRHRAGTHQKTYLYWSNYVQS
jgi:hypothetical protein